MLKLLFGSIWVKCTSFLLALTVILGGSLAILNDALYVSPEERTARAVKKIYGRVVEDINEPEFDGIEYKNLGKINRILYVEDDILFQSTGYNGYKNGTITLWIKVSNNKIDKIIMESYDKQTLMSKFTGSYYSKFYIDVTDDTDLFTPKADGSSSNVNPMTGATKSATAACNAVNCVITYLGGL